MSYKSQKRLFVSDLALAGIRGPYTLSAYITINGARQLISNFSVFGGSSAPIDEKEHIAVVANFPLNDFTDEEIANGVFDVEVRGREMFNKGLFEKFRAQAATDRKPYMLEIK